MSSILYNKDSTKDMREIDDNSVHLILSDIPYGIGIEDWDVLHDNKNSAYLGSSPAQKKSGELFKKRGKPINGWSESDKMISKQYYDWCCSWVKEWNRILKPGGSAIIFAGRRYSHRCICAMEDNGFNLKDLLAWIKESSIYKAQRISNIFDKRNDIENSKKWNDWRLGNLRPLFEQVIWFTKSYKIGNTLTDNIIENEVGGFNQETFLKYEKNTNNIITQKFEKNEEKLHPTQKPLNLMKELIELTTIKGQTVVDPFCGSGTTLVAANQLERNSIGYEIDNNYYNIALNRIGEQ